jgi:hypothetical protein
MSTGKETLPVTPQPVPKKRNRWWRRIGLFLLLATATLAVLAQTTDTGRLLVTVGVQSVRYDQLRRAEQAAATALEKRGAIVVKNLPDHDVNSINLCEKPIDDDAARDIAALYRLQVANLYKTGINDERLRCVSGLAWLSSLAVGYTPVTDAGLAHIEYLPSLEGLNLPGTKVTDAGLTRIARLTQLKILDLSETAVTDAGLSTLAPLKELSYLLLAGDDITDAGLKQLESMKSLRRVTLLRTKATPAGIASLKQAIGNDLVVDFEGSERSQKHP